jgi:hypothetical protein
VLLLSLYVFLPLQKFANIFFMNYDRNKLIKILFGDYLYIIL